VGAATGGGGTNSMNTVSAPEDEQRRAIYRLAMIIGAGVLAAAITGVAKTVAVVIAIVVMIMLHELGHFATAKWADMKVTEYFLGFGPRLWSIRRGETEYGIKAIPAGGYVKIIGMTNLEEVDPADESRTYRQKPFWRRLSVAVAGSTMHFIIAFVLLWVLFAFVGNPGIPKPIVNAISELQDGRSPADEAGIQLGDRILSVDNHPVKTWEDLPDYIQARPNQPIDFEIQRAGQVIHLTVTPVDRSKHHAAPSKNAGPDPTKPTGFVGIGPLVPVQKYDPITAVGHAGAQLGSYTKATLGALGHLATFQGLQSYSDQLTGKATGPPTKDTTRFLSPIGLVRVAHQAVDVGLFQVLNLLILINVFVGIFNMVPLLPLDGGHVAIAVYEKIRSRFSGRRYFADVAKMMPVTYMVFLLLVFLGVTSLYLDIVRPL
jgi:membrane-associated protease RseP (regulator of RpoE activity)